jgi:hypothetical protein
MSPSLYSHFFSTKTNNRDTGGLVWSFMCWNMIALHWRPISNSLASLNFLHTLLNANTSCGGQLECKVWPKQQPLILGHPPKAFNASSKRSTSSILSGEFLTQPGSVVWPQLNPKQPYFCPIQQPLELHLYHFWERQLPWGKHAKLTSKSGWSNGRESTGPMVHFVVTWRDRDRDSKIRTKSKSNLFWPNLLVKNPLGSQKH